MLDKSTSEVCQSWVLLSDGVLSLYMINNTASFFSKAKGKVTDFFSNIFVSTNYMYLNKMSISTFGSVRPTAQNPKMLGLQKKGTPK